MQIFVKRCIFLILQIIYIFLNFPRKVSLLVSLVWLVFWTSWVSRQEAAASLSQSHRVCFISFVSFSLLFLFLFLRLKRVRVSLTKEVTITLYWSDKMPTCWACLRTSLSMSYEQSIMMFSISDVLTSCIISLHRIRRQAVQLTHVFLGKLSRLLSSSIFLVPASHVRGDCNGVICKDANSKLPIAR